MLTKMCRIAEKYIREYEKWMIWEMKNTKIGEKKEHTGKENFEKEKKKENNTIMSVGER